MRIDLKASIGSGTCKKCGEKVVWVKSKSGKNIAFDNDSLYITTISKGGWLDKEQNTCHFETCSGTQEG